MGAEKRVVFHVIEIGCGFDVEVCYAVCLGGVGAKNVLPFLGLVFIYVPQPGACVTTQAPEARLGYGRGFLSPAGADGNRKGPGCSGPVRAPRQGGGRHQTGVSIIALIDALWASACCGTSRT
jgi:hypothetical protein